MPDLNTNMILKNGALSFLEAMAKSVSKWNIVGAPGWLSWLSVQLLVLAQVLISQLVRLSPALGSALTVQSLLVVLCLPLCHSPTHSVFLKNKKKINIKK